MRKFVSSIWSVDFPGRRGGESGRDPNTQASFEGPGDQEVVGLERWEPLTGWAGPATARTGQVAVDFLKNLARPYIELIAVFSPDVVDTSSRRGAALSKDRFNEPTRRGAELEFGHRRERLLRKTARGNAG